MNWAFPPKDDGVTAWRCRAFPSFSQATKRFPGWQLCAAQNRMLNLSQSISQGLPSLCGTSQNPCECFRHREESTSKAALAKTRLDGEASCPAACPRRFTFRSKQIGEFCVRGDSCGRKGSGERYLNIACGVVSGKLKPPRVVISVRTQRDFLKNLRPTRRIADAPRTA